MSSRTEYFIDEAAADGRYSQSFRRQAYEFAYENRISITSREHASAFLAYYRERRKVQGLLERAAGRFGYSDEEMKEAFAILHSDFRIPEDLVSARILLNEARERMAEKRAAPRPQVAAPPVASMATQPAAIPAQPPSKNTAVPGATEKFMRRLARRNGFTAKEAAAALELCAKYRWFPEPPRKFLGLHITRAGKERHDALVSEALDLLMQARHGYDYVRMLGERGIPSGPLRDAVLDAVVSRYFSSERRIVSEEVLAEMRSEHEFLSNPALYVYNFGKSGGFPRRVYMKAAERMRGDAASQETPPVKLQQTHPDVYCKGVLEDTKARLAHESELTSVLPRPPALSDEQKIRNSVLIDQAGSEMGLPVALWNRAKEAAEATGTVLSESREASSYLGMARAYAPREKKVLMLIKKVARKYGYSDAETETATRLSRDCFFIPTDIHSACDLLLQARLKMQGRMGEYVWMVAEEGLYPYSVAAEVERRYLAAGIPLSRPELLAYLKEEKEFQDDVISFVRDSCRVVLIQTRMLYGPKAEEGLMQAMDSVAYALQQIRAGTSGKTIPAELLRLPRAEQVRQLVGNERYISWANSFRPRPSPAAVKKAPEAPPLAEAPAQVPVVAPAKDESRCREEQLIKDAAARILAEAGELTTGLEIARISNADPEIAQLLCKAWKSLNGEDISEEGALRMLAENRGGLLKEFRKHPKAIGAKELVERLEALMQKIGPRKERTDNSLALATEEALRLVNEGKAAPNSPEEAYDLLEDVLFTIRTRNYVRNRVERGFFPPEIGEKALKLLLSSNPPDLGSTDDGPEERIRKEMQFFASLCAEGGHPYPSKLFIYLMKKHGGFSQDAADEAIRRINSENPALPDEEAVREFVKKIEGGIAARQAEKAAATVPSYVTNGMRRRVAIFPNPVGPTCFASTLVVDDSGLLPSGRGRRRLEVVPHIGEEEADTGPIPLTRQKEPPAAPEAPAAEEPEQARSTIYSPPPPELVAASALPPVEPPAAPEVPSKTGTVQGMPLIGPGVYVPLPPRPVPPEKPVASFPPPDQWQTIRMPAPPAQAELPTAKEVEDALERLSAPPPAPAEMPAAPEAPAAEEQEDSRPTSISPPPAALVEDSRPEDARPTVCSPPVPELVASSMDSGREVARLVKALHTARATEARLAAVQGLMQIGSPAALCGLAGALDYPDLALDVSAILISHPDSAAVIQAVAGEFGSSTREGKLNALSVLAGIGTQEAFDAVSVALIDPEPEVAEDAARRLLTAHGAGIADTHRYFMNLDFNSTLSLLSRLLVGKEGSEREGADFEAAKLLAEFAGRYPDDVYPVLCSAIHRAGRDVALMAVAALRGGGLQYLPGIYSSRSTKDNLELIAALGNMVTEEACDLLAPMLLHGSREVAEDACHQLLLLHGRNGLDTHRYLLAIDFSGVEPLLGKMLKYKDDAKPRLEAARLLAGLAAAGKHTSRIYPLLGSALDDENMEVVDVVMRSLHEGGFVALHHLEGVLLDRKSPQPAVERAAELFLSAKGEDGDVHYAYWVLLQAASENNGVMETLEAEASFSHVCGVLNDDSTPLAARRSAALLVGKKGEDVAVPLLLTAYIQQPDLRETIPPILSQMNRGRMLSAALSESKKFGRVHDPLIHQLVSEYGSRAVAHLASYAEQEAAEGSLTPEECRFLISLAMETGFEKTDALRLLTCILPVLRAMDDEGKVAVAQFSKRIGEGAIDAILAYAEAASMKGLGADNAYVLCIVVEDIGAKKGVELLRHVLPEMPNMNAVQLEQVQDLAFRLDAARAEEILLEYANERAQTGKLTPREALVLSGLASTFGVLNNSSKCAALLGHMLPLLQDMSPADISMVQDFASLPVFRDEAVGRIELFLSGKEKGGITPKEAGAVAVMLACINSDASFRALSRLVSEENLAYDEVVKVSRGVEKALSTAYKKDGVRECLLRAAFGRGELSNLGLIAFDIFRTQKDSGGDLIRACVRAHLFSDTEAVQNADRLREARAILVRNGDAAIGGLCDVVLSPDFSLYPSEHRRNALVTIAEIAGYTRRTKGHKQSRATMERARECVMKTITMHELGEEVVARALCEMGNVNIADAVAGILGTEDGERHAARIYAILSLMGDRAQVQIGEMLQSGDTGRMVQGADIFAGIIRSRRSSLAELARLPGFVSNTKLLAGLLRHRDGRVRTYAEDALRAASPHVPLEDLRRVVLYRAPSASGLLPGDVELGSRRSAAELMASAGEAAAQHFIAVFRERGMPHRVASEVLGVAAGAAALAEKLMEPMALAAENGEIEDKYAALNFALELDGQFPGLLRKACSGNLQGADLQAGSSYKPWQKMLLKWAAVKALVYRGEASAASCMMNSPDPLFTAGEFGALLREAIEKRAGDERMLPRERAELIKYYIGRFTGREQARINTVLHSPERPPSEDLPLPRNLRGFVRTTPPPLQVKGQRRLHRTQGGGNGSPTA